MNKKVLLITSTRTGLGHKSVSTAITQQISLHNNQIEVKTINGFLLANHLGDLTERAYIPLVKHARPLWKFYYEFGSKHNKFLNLYIATTIRKNFYKTIQEYNPDLIVSVHPGFIGSPLNLLEKNKIKIPFIVVICDMFRISNLWIDKRADYTICPNPEHKQLLLDHGLREEQIVINGFPLRNQFTMQLKKLSVSNTLPIKVEGSFENNMKVLYICNAEKISLAKEVICTLWEHYHCSVTVVTGTNKRLKKELEYLAENRKISNIEIHGYVNEVAKLMLNAHILITKGGPNIIMEAINCSLPMVLMGTLPGQEEGNNEFVEKNYLGVICNQTQHLITTIDKLIEGNGSALLRIKENQKKHQCLDAVENIVKLIEYILQKELPL